MNNGNNSGSQSGQSGSASNKSGGSSQSQPHGGNSGNAGSSDPDLDRYQKHAEKVVRRMAWNMAKGCTNSYSERLFLADHFYDKFMDD